MADIWNIVFDIIKMAIDGMKVIPVYTFDDGRFVSLFHFNIGILIITIVSLAFVSIVNVSASSVSADDVRNARANAKERFNKSEFGSWWNAGK